ncbi:hypothetical protein LCGC14_2930290 [marine sediment metagenome]|uniref:Uncharacterized protein n=1 Tax=marine sediment metagenome TaxID=412755 RepID=A0A0F8ZTS3_9ZZZZ
MTIEYTDLRSITRSSDIARTTIGIYMGAKWEGYDAFNPWLEFGVCEVRNEENLCWIIARLDYGVTDFEHDSAYALRFPLIGLKFSRVYGHYTCLKAYVDPNNVEEFHVPGPGYNPVALENAHECSDCEESHIIVPEGYYVPPVNKELYEKVRGREVEIRIGPVYNREV